MHRHKATVVVDESTAMKSLAVGLLTSEGNTTRGATKPAEPALHMPLPKKMSDALSFWSKPTKMPAQPFQYKRT